MDVTVSSDAGHHSDGLFRAILEGKDIGPVEILFVKEGKPYLTVKLTGVAVVSFNISGSPGGDGQAHRELDDAAEKIEYWRPATGTSE